MNEENKNQTVENANDASGQGDNIIKAPAVPQPQTPIQTPVAPQAQAPAQASVAPQVRAPAAPVAPQVDTSTNPQSQAPTQPIETQQPSDSAVLNKVDKEEHTKGPLDSPFEVEATESNSEANSEPKNQDIGTDNSHLDFLNNVPAQYRNKNFFYAGIFVVFLIGMMMGALFFGGDEVVSGPPGLQGVVRNTEVPAGRPRCGMVEYGQGCVLYIVNAQRKEVTAKELYAMAAQMTKVPVYIIETGNLRYNNTLIKPGYIAQINIQPVR